MARVKKSQSQLNKEAYERYKLALEYYNIKLKPLKNPTAKSVEKAKAIWKRNNEQLKLQGYESLPTPAQAAKYIHQRHEQWFNKVAQIEAEASAPKVEEVANVEDTLAAIEIREMFNALFAIHGDYDQQSHVPSHNEYMKHKKAQEHLMQKVEWARQKVGDYELAKAIKQSDYMGRVEMLIYSTHYLFQETEVFEVDAPAMFDALVEQVLDEL